MDDIDVKVTRCGTHHRPGLVRTRDTAPRWAGVTMSRCPSATDLAGPATRRKQQERSAAIFFGEHLILGSWKIVNSCDGHATALVI